MIFLITSSILFGNIFVYCFFLLYNKLGVKWFPVYNINAYNFIYFC